MGRETFNSSQEYNIRSLLVSAEEEARALLELNKKYQSSLFSLNSSRRKLLFIANDSETLSKIISLINDLELIRDAIESSRCRLSALLSSAMSYLVSIAENAQDMQSVPMRRLRNDLRTITNIVQDTKAMNVDYSTLASLATRGALLMRMKDKGVSSEMTNRLFFVLKNTIV